ncbi:MAG: YlbF family regulator [Acholeplasmataceae bacterium]
MSERDKLIEMIEESDRIKRYQRLEKIINNSEEIKSRMQDLKELQQQMINAREMGKSRAFNDFKRRYNALKEEIETYPLMSEYLSLQEEINDAIQHIIEEIERKIHDRLRL